MPVWLIKVLLAIVPRPGEVLKLLLLVIFIPGVLVITFFSAPAVMVKNIPMAAPSQIQYYVDAAENVSDDKITKKKKDINIDWRKLVAIDAVLLENNFKKTSYDRAEWLAECFIEEDGTIIIQVPARDPDTNKIIRDPDTNKPVMEDKEIDVYRLKDFDEVLQELVADGELKPRQVADVYNYYKFDIASLKDVGDGSDMPANWRPVESAYKWPVPGYYRLSSKFGPRYHPVEHIDGFHYGIDIPAPKGTSVYASKEGTVLGAGYLSLKGGNTVIILHPDGTKTKYLHLSKALVKKSKKVTTDTIIGEVGSTGASTGNHLHYEIVVNGSSVDPLKYYGY